MKAGYHKLVHVLIPRDLIGEFDELLRRVRIALQYSSGSGFA